MPKGFLRKICGKQASPMTKLVERPFARTTWVSWYQNVSLLDFTGAKDEFIDQLGFGWSL